MMMQRKKQRNTTSQQGNREPMAVKVADLNSMVQIRKKAPAKTFKEKMAYRQEK